MDQVLQVLQVLRIKGRATPDTLATAMGVEVTDVIEQCERAELVENTKIGYRITDLGRERVDELYVSERTRAEAVIVDTYETFLPINDEVKQVVTDWQMRVVDGQMVLNDHADPCHDDNVIARLHDVDAKAAPALESLTSALPRFDLYSRRLRAGARRDPRRRPHDGCGADQGQLPHRVVRAPRGSHLAVRARAHGGLSLSCSRGSAGPPTRCRPDRGTR